MYLNAHVSFYACPTHYSNFEEAHHQLLALAANIGRLTVTFQAIGSTFFYGGGVYEGCPTNTTIGGSGLLTR